LARQGLRAFQDLRVGLATKDPLVLLGRQEPMDHKARQDLRGRQHRVGRLDPLGHLDHLDSRDLLDLPGHKGRRGSQVIRGRKGHRALLGPEGKLEQPVQPARWALLDLRDPRDKQDRPALLAPQVLQEYLALLDLLAPSDLRERQELPGLPFVFSFSNARQEDDAAPDAVTMSILLAAPVTEATNSPWTRTASIVFLWWRPKAACEPGRFAPKNNRLSAGYSSGRDNLQGF